MSWIRTIAPEEAEGELSRLYEQLRSADGQVDNILIAHGLRPATLRGHLALYKAALHSAGNALAPWERELVGVLVSKLNGCRYCAQHHQAGLARHLGDGEEAARRAQAAEAGDPAVLDARRLALCRYARKLTREPQSMTAGDVEALRDAGLDDGAILDLNQVVAYFAYANRTVQGLGVEVGDETLGLHPDQNREDYRHV